MTDLDFKTIGRKIKEQRIALGITQEAIANYLDVNPSHISNIECGRANPSLTALVKIANFLHCSVDCFICEEYTFQNTESLNSILDETITQKLKYCNPNLKAKLLKILDILQAE